MKITNTMYDAGKWTVLVFLPAFAVLISGLGELYGWGNTATITGTINIFTAFLGSILQLSSSKYHKNIGQKGGTNDESKCSKSS